MSMVRHIIYHGLALLVVASCAKIKSYPVQPKIAFKSITIRDSVMASETARFAIILFSITDGDGDVGLKQEDTLYPYLGDSAFNVFCNWHVMCRGKETDGARLNIPTFKYRMPFLGEERKKAILANAYLYINLQSFMKSYPYDTLRFSFHITDKSFNESNVDTTSEFSISKKTSITSAYRP